MKDWKENVPTKVLAAADQFIKELKAGHFKKAILPNSGSPFDYNSSSDSFDAEIRRDDDAIRKSRQLRADE